MCAKIKYFSFLKNLTSYKKNKNTTAFSINCNYSNKGVQLHMCVKIKYFSFIKNLTCYKKNKNTTAFSINCNYSKKKVCNCKCVPKLNIARLSLTNMSYEAFYFKATFTNWTFLFRRPDIQNFRKRTSVKADRSDNANFINNSTAVNSLITAKLLIISANQSPSVVIDTSQIGSIHYCDYFFIVKFLSINNVLDTFYCDNLDLGSVPMVDFLYDRTELHTIVL